MRSVIGSPSAVWLLWPFIIVMGILFAAPVLLIVAYSFMKPGILGGVTWDFSLDAYVQFFFEQDFDGNWAFNSGYIEIFWRSLKLAGFGTLLSLLAGFPIAYFMATRPENQRHIWLILITVPFWTNLLIRTYAWILILRSEGLVNYALISGGIITTPLQLLYNDFSVGLGLLYSFLPFMILPIYSSLERMDWRLAEASADLYANRWQTLWHVIIPQARPGIFAGIILVFVPAIGSYLAADLLGGGKHLMIGNMIDMQFTFARNWPLGSATAVLLMLAGFIGLALLARKKSLQALT